MNTKDELTSVFQTVFEDSDIVLTRESTANDIEGWDSLSHVTMLMAVEDHFEIEFAQWEVMNLPDVGALLDLVEKKISEK